MSADHRQESLRPPPRYVSGPRKLLGLVVLLAVGLAFFLLHSGLVTSFEIDGPSMVPTLRQGERVFVRTLGDEPLTYGDLVVFRNPTPHLDQEMLVKRVVGLPGDHVEVISHRLYVNDVPCLIPLLGEVILPDLRTGTWTLRDGELYVIGDNWANSHDSTEFGSLALADVIGRVGYRYWPLSRLGAVN